MRVRGLRGRLLLVVLAGAAVTLAILTAGFNVVLDRSLERDANDRLRARASAQLSAVSVNGGRIAVAEAPDEAAVDSRLWIYKGPRALEHPATSADVARAADSLAGGPRRFADIAKRDTRLYAVPIVDHDRRVGTLVTATSLAPYERTAHTALIASLGFAGAILVVVGVAAYLVIGGALRPVARMTSEAAEWSEHDLDKRFAIGEPRDELTRLAATFDALLDRLATSLRREQRFSAEISHELRTPLAKLQGEAELALRRERTPDQYRQALGAIHRSSEQLSRTLEALLSAARAESAQTHAVSDAHAAAERALEGCAPLAEERGIELKLNEKAGVARVGADTDLVERILAPLVENGCRYGTGTVELTIEQHNGTIAFTVSDDGVGVPEEERGRVFEPGFRGAASNGPTPGGGAGLGLALARRLARAAGGEVECLPSVNGGLFRVRLPRA
jgi:signal transduction histidine kinase